MNTRFLQRVTLVLAPLALIASPALGQTQQKPLDDKDNPLMIGKRNINKGQIDFYSLDKEVALGRQLAAEVDRESKFVTDPIVTEYVNRVGQNIVLHSDVKAPVEIKVIDSNEVNAFALPGGHLYINRGVLETADNEAELAGVIAHETGHVAARHGVEQASKANLINYGSIPLIFLGGIGGFAIRQAAGLAVPLTFLKFSRGAEEEADRLGAQYMWAAGYDPHAMVTFFEKLEAKEKKKPGTIAKAFSTHPMTSDRIKEVGNLVARFPDKQEYEISSSDFSSVKSRLVSINAARRSGDERNGRPTLKRRPSSTSAGGGDDSGPAEQPSDRPTLKRGDSSGATDGSGQGPEKTERPTLKRSGNANPNPDQER
ncbi:MAG TPA: M48 family metallopeptidase [Blastocatellia bacterium]|nr:M48 family metallopeptidase [Blastocatellia bacterium]